jgi:hypothetical protein
VVISSQAVVYRCNEDNSRKLFGGCSVFKDLEVILSEGESYTVEFKESPDKDIPSEV